MHNAAHLTLAITAESHSPCVMTITWHWQNISQK